MNSRKVLFSHAETKLATYLKRILGVNFKTNVDDKNVQLVKMCKNFEKQCRKKIRFSLLDWTLVFFRNMHYVLMARITFALVIKPNSLAELDVDVNLPQNYGSKYKAASLAVNTDVRIPATDSDPYWQ